MFVTPFLFYLFAFGLIGASIGAIFSRNLIYASLWLVGAILNASGLCILLKAKILALTLTFGYTSALIGLFLGVFKRIPLLLFMRLHFFKKQRVYLFVGLILMVEMLCILIYQLKLGDLPPLSRLASLNKTPKSNLFQDYLFTLPGVGFLILGTLIGVLTLKRASRKHTLIRSLLNKFFPNLPDLKSSFSSKKRPISE